MGMESRGRMRRAGNKIKLDEEEPEGGAKSSVLRKGLTTKKLGIKEGMNVMEKKWQTADVNWGLPSSLVLLLFCLFSS